MMWLPSLLGASGKGSTPKAKDCASRPLPFRELRGCTAKDRMQDTACLRLLDGEPSGMPNVGGRGSPAQSSGKGTEEEAPECREESLWPLEVSLQGLAESSVHQWLSLVRSLSFTSTSSTSSLAESHSTSSLSSAGLPEEFTSEKELHCNGASQKGSGPANEPTPVARASKRPARWNAFLLNAAPSIWPAITLSIILAPQAACVAAALLFPGLVRPALSAWLAVEAVFLAYRAAEWARASRNVVPESVPSVEVVSELLDHMLSLSDMGVIHPHEFVSGWFLGAPPASLTLQDLREFLAFGLYHRDLHELPEEWQEAVEENADRMNTRWALQLPPAPTLEPSKNGSTGSQKQGNRGPGVSLGPVTVGRSGRGWFMSGGGRFMRHTKEPLRALLHPFALYAWGHIVGGLTSLALSALGFKRQRCTKSGIGYYIRKREGSELEEQSQEQAQDPVRPQAMPQGRGGGQIHQQCPLEDENRVQELFRGQSQQQVSGREQGQQQELGREQGHQQKIGREQGHQHNSRGKGLPLFERGSYSEDSEVEAPGTPEACSFGRKSLCGAFTDSDEEEALDSEIWCTSSIGTSTTSSTATRPTLHDENSIGNTTTTGSRSNISSCPTSSSSSPTTRSSSPTTSSSNPTTSSSSPSPTSSSSPRPTSNSDKGEACVFVHGLGFGVTPYLGFIHQILRASRHQTVAVVELPHLAFQLCSSVPTVDEILPALDEIVEECVGPQRKASFIGHSYGSLVLAQFVRMRPSRVASLGLMDPVCILLCLPFVVYNFLYKLVDFDSVKGTVSDAARMLFCSLELNVSRALCRGFNWHKLQVWAHHLPKNTVVMLSGEDRIVPAERVRRYLETHKVHTHYHDSLGHAQFLFSNDAMLFKSIELIHDGYEASLVFPLHSRRRARGPRSFDAMDDDPELAAIRQRRMQELMGASGGARGPPGAGAGGAPQQKEQQEEQRREAEERRQMMLSQLLTSDARERLARIALVKPEKARGVEDVIIQGAQRGQLRERVTEERLISLLEQINEQTQSQTRVTIQRRRSAFDDDEK